MSGIKTVAWSIGTLAGLTGLFFGGRYVFNLLSFKKSLLVTQTVETEVTDTMLGVPIGFNLKVTPTIKNPSESELRISQPYVEVRLSLTGDPISSSDLTNKDFPIKALSQVVFDPIVLNINLKSSVLDVVSFVKNALKQKQIGMYIKVICVINQGTPQSIRIEQPTKKILKF